MDNNSNSIINAATENWWLSCSEISYLLAITPSSVERHLKKLFNQQLLCANKVRKYKYIDKKTQLEVYNLDAIIALAYHINSAGAMHFRNELIKSLIKKDNSFEKIIINLPPQSQNERNLN